MHIKSRKLRDCHGLYDVNLMDKQKTLYLLNMETTERQ